MLRAVIFDFDGVIADAEPLHLLGFQRVLGSMGITLTEEQYFADYLAFDDKTCFRVVLERSGIEPTPERIEGLIAEKAILVRSLMDEDLVILPGAAGFVAMLAGHYPLAIASGALREEIVLVLARTSLAGYFGVIVSAEDVESCKPHPEPFLSALAGLNTLAAGGERPLLPSECLVVEDSIYGVEGALRAGMRCMAVTNSYAREELGAADLVVDSLDEPTLDEIRSLF